jgi:hypothetical protein
MGFSVACMAREPRDVLERFIAHYRTLGAERILLYYDGDTAHLGLTPPEGVELIACDAAFWEPHGGRPGMFVPSQGIVYRDGFARNRSDWLLLCDIDEFVEGDAAPALASVPDGIDYVRLRPAEAVWAAGEDVEVPFANRLFRLPTRRYLGKPLSLVAYGRDFRVFQRGILSHITGKSFVRRGAAFTSLGSHTPRGIDASRGAWLHRIVPGARVSLHHFSAISFSRWKRKLGGRIDGSRATLVRGGWKQNLLAAFAAHAAEGRERELFDRLYVLNPGQIRLLRGCGLLVERRP